MASVVVACGAVSPGAERRSFFRSSRGLLFGAIAACLSVAAGALVAGAFANLDSNGQIAGQTAAHGTAPGAAAAKQGRLHAALDLRSLSPKVPAERNIRVRKFSRLSKTPADQLWPAGLTVSVIKGHYEKRAQFAAAKLQRETVEKARAYALAATSRIKAGTVAEAAAVVQPSLVSALVDPGAVRADTTGKPFDLVMPEEMAELGLPDAIPLPEARPKRLAKAIDEDDTGRRSKPAARELAYASPSQLKDDDEVRETRPGLFGGFGRRAKGRTAYYDISAGVVHLPNGERLEAHSGIGKMRDNPKYTHMQMRGATPPGTFKLSMREKLFHGVQALRMTSVDGRHPQGRTGLLTHSYLLGPNGNSHGCVAFKNYPRFLAAFKRGEIDTLVVVPSVSSTRIASLFGKRT